MSKQTRNGIAMIVLTLFLVLIIVIVNHITPDATANVRTITDKSEAQYQVEAVLTMTGEARATYTPTP